MLAQVWDYNVVTSIGHVTQMGPAISTWRRVTSQHDVMWRHSFTSDLGLWWRHYITGRHQKTSVRNIKHMSREVRQRWGVFISIWWQSLDWAKSPVTVACMLIQKCATFESQDAELTGWDLGQASELLISFRPWFLTACKKLVWMFSLK